MPDIVVDRTTYIKIGNAEPITTGIAEGSMLIDRVLFVDDFRFGQFTSSRFEIQVYGLSNVAKQKIEVYQMSNDTRTDLFAGEIESSKLDNAGYYRDIIAYDMFYFIARKDVSSWFNSLWTNNVTQISVLDAFKSLLTYFNLSYDTNTVKAANFTGTLYKDSVVEFEKISFKDMVKYMLEPLALIPYVDASGKVAVYSPSMASSVNLASKYDKNASVFEEYEVQPMQWVGIVDIDSAVIQQAEISGNTSDIRYDLPYNPLRLDLYSEEGSSAKTAVLNDFITKADFEIYTPCEVGMIVSDTSINLGDIIETAHGTSYVSEIILSGPMLVEQQLISRGSPVQQEVEEDYDPVFSYLTNKITDTEDGLAELQDEIDNYEPSDEYTAKVQEFSNVMVQGLGLKTKIITDAQTGAKITYYYAPASAETPNTMTGSKFVFVMKSTGLAWTDKWEGSGDGTSESHTDPVSGETVNTIWGQGIGADGSSIVKILNAYKITADAIQAGAITVGGLGQDVLNLIEQGSDGINVHATAGTLSTNNYPLTTSEGVTELAEGDVVAITFPNGVDFTLNTSGNTYLYKPRTVSIGNNTYTLLNANGTTDWCNVKDSADYSGNVTVKYIARLLDSTLKLCELVEVENVVDKVLESAAHPNILQLTELLTSAASGTVLKCDITELQHGMAIMPMSNNPNQLDSPYFKFLNSGSYLWLLSKAGYSGSEGFADAYTLEELDVMGNDSADYSGTSATSGSTQQKTANISPFNLAVGVTVDITFTYENTANYPTLYIPLAGTSPGICYRNGSNLTAMPASHELNWGAGQTRRFTYESGVWVISLPTTYYSPKDKTSVNIILENLRTSSGTALRAFELRYDPYSTAPAAIDEEAREAARQARADAAAALIAASDASSTASGANKLSTQLRTKLINLCTDNNMTIIDGGNVYADTLNASDALLYRLMAHKAMITGNLTLAAQNDWTTDIDYSELDEVAVLFKFTDWDQLQAALSSKEKSDIIDLLKLLVLFKGNFSKSQLFYRVLKTGDDRIIGAMTPYGLCWCDSYNSNSSIYNPSTGTETSPVYLSSYGYNCNIAGRLYVRSKYVPATFSRCVRIEIPAGSTSARKTVRIYGFQEEPVVQLTVAKYSTDNTFEKATAVVEQIITAHNYYGIKIAVIAQSTSSNDRNIYVHVTATENTATTDDTASS